MATLVQLRILIGFAVAFLPVRAANAFDDFEVMPSVEALAQPTPNTCWAATATMLYAWQQRASYSIQDVVTEAGDRYATLFRTDDPLSASLKLGLLSALGLVAEPPSDPSISGWRDLLIKHGPLWVTTVDSGTGFSIHARIIVGIAGDGTPDGTLMTIVDPIGGVTTQEVFTTFVRKFEEVAKRDIGQGGDLRTQIVHSLP